VIISRLVFEASKHHVHRFRRFMWLQVRHPSPRRPFNCTSRYQSKI
jgi:hypothetical protein